jgi:lysozyme
MIVSAKGISFIKAFEGLRLAAYQDKAGIWTIGFGTVILKDGTAVKEGDIITVEQALDLLNFQINLKASAVRHLGINFNQNQFDVATSFTYNEGVGALNSASWVQLARVNPQDPNIRVHYMEWNKIRHAGILVEDDGLTARRQHEMNIYFS